MRLVSWKPLRKNSLLGFACIELPVGLIIADVPVLVSGGKAWAALPSKPMVDGDGHHKRDVNGKPAYVAIRSWRDRELANRFSDRVISLRAEYPDAIEAAA
jgi:hypothetical protein